MEGEIMNQRVGKKQYPSGAAGVCDRRCRYCREKEGEGPLEPCLTWWERMISSAVRPGRRAESNLQKDAVYMVMEKAGWKAEDVSYLFAGDLLGQCIATSFGISAYNIPLFESMVPALPAGKR